MSYCQFELPGFSNRIARYYNPRIGSVDFSAYSAGTKVYSIKLLRNYRSHPTILSLPNRMFYKSELQPFADPLVTNRLLPWELLPNHKAPVLFMHTVGKDMRTGESPSWYNITEIQRVQQVIQSLKDNRTGFQGLENSQIGVITPYQRQAQSIRSVLRNKYDGIQVGTVETFQGQERMVIIISTVRSNPEYLEFDSKFNLGFLNDPKRFNVSMTRAKALLVVIGNGNILCQDPCWNQWIRFCIDNHCVNGLDDELHKNVLKEWKETESDDDSDEEDLIAFEAGWRQLE